MENWGNLTNDISLYCKIIMPAEYIVTGLFYGQVTALTNRTEAIFDIDL